MTTLVNAEIKSEEELEERLRNGEVFYTCGGSLRIFYDFSFLKNGESPYRFGDHSLSSEWGNFPMLMKKFPWYENTKEPVLCWVSDRSPSDRILAIRVMTKKNGSWSYIDDTGIGWEYATPVKANELLNNGELK